MMGANATRIREISIQHPQVAVSVLVGNLRQVDRGRGSEIGTFLT
jgi:hypothetical protein